MKIALISDVHANFPALESVFEEISGVDEVICAGDVIGYNPYPSKVISFFKEKEIFSVLGNHDLAFLEEDTSWFNPYAAEAINWAIEKTSQDEKEYIRSLPKHLEKEFGDISFYVTHGSPSSISEYVYPGTSSFKLRGMLSEVDSDVLVLGHTHIPFIKEFDEGFVVNPGSVGQPRDGDKRASCLVINLGEMNFELHRIEYDIKKVNKEIEESSLPNKLGNRLFYGQ